MKQTGHNLILGQQFTRCTRLLGYSAQLLNDCNTPILLRWRRC